MSPCDKCGMLLPASKISEHKHSAHKKTGRFECADCGKFYKAKAGLAAHVLVAHVKREMKCPHDGCDKIYFNRAVLRVHIKARHGPARPRFQCDRCDKSFQSKSTLAEHVKGVHMGILHYCRFCEKGYNRKTHMSRHEKRCCALNTQKRSKLT